VTIYNLVNIKRAIYDYEIKKKLKRRLAESFLEESFLLNIEENNPRIGGGKKEGVINWKIETEKAKKVKAT
jgi:hypothetical protein